MSPFSEYETWVDLSQLKADTRDNLDNQKFPSKAAADDLESASEVQVQQEQLKKGKRKAPKSKEVDDQWKAAVAKLQRQKPTSTQPILTTVFDMHVSAHSIFRAAGKRKGYAGQQQVMGFSATAVRFLERLANSINAYNPQMANKFKWEMLLPGVPSAAEVRYWYHVP